MPDLAQFALFLLAAALVITPGPGIFYVAARTLAGGRAGGVASSFGTGLEGLFHAVDYPKRVQRIREASGGALLALGVGLLFARRSGDQPALRSSAACVRRYRYGNHDPGGGR